MKDPDDETLLDALFGAAPDNAEPTDRTHPPATDPGQSAEPSEASEPSEPSEPPLPGTLPQAPPRSAFQAPPRSAFQSTAPDAADRRGRTLPSWMRSSVRPSAPGCREVGLTTIGFVIFVSVDSVMMYAPFRMSGGTSLLPQAITLLLLAFGLGALMIWSIRGAWRPVGVGMMLGWVFMTLVSAGYFTGLNP